jgi:PTS system glucitol/sorbitol-specific IIB component/PTS system glucitol/sorbitol-specific IIC component
MADMSDQTYRTVTVSRGEAGWGGPLTITPTAAKPLIYSVTGGGIHPVAERIAELTGGMPFDGFHGTAPLEQVAVVVVDCGGTARVGVYPMKRVLTVDVHSTTPSGPLAQFITEDLFVSGVGPDDIQSA